MARSTPIQFNVPDMDCASCVAAITAAVHGIDAAADVHADLTTKRVVVAGEGETQDYMAAIEGAGFTIKSAA